jgi:hypothetical protein
MKFKQSEWRVGETYISPVDPSQLVTDARADGHAAGLWFPYLMLNHLT